ncbi:hypothetical protein BJX96DRAFT_138300 [Aspergillus floccosus]
MAFLLVGAYCLVAGGTPGDPQQPLEQAAVSLVLLLVTAACCLDNAVVSASLQQAPELTGFSVLVGAHCLATVGGSGDPQQPLEQVPVLFDLLFVRDACDPANALASDLLQQPPELTILLLLVVAHCLATVAGSGEPQQSLEHASPLPFRLALRCPPDSRLPPEQQESSEARTDREESTERRSLPREARVGGAQQDSCPRAIRARQMQPSASSLAAYLARAERRCLSHGAPSGPWQLGLGAPGVLMSLLETRSDERTSTYSRIHPEKRMELVLGYIRGGRCDPGRRHHSREMACLCSSWERPSPLPVVDAGTGRPCVLHSRNQSGRPW